MLTDDRFKIDGYEELQARIVELKAGWPKLVSNASLSPRARTYDVDADEEAEGEG